MNTLDKCKNCGGDRSLHHFETDQCPVDGREAPIGRKQEWKSTIFEEVEVTESEVERLNKVVKDLLARVEELEEKVESMKGESDLAETVRIWGAG
jgi:hypothetical protein